MNENSLTIKEQQIAIRRLRRSCVIRIAAFGLAVLLTFTLLLGVAVIRTDALAPALHSGDLVLYLRPGEPARGETVIYEEKGKRRVGQIAAEGSETATVLVLKDRRKQTWDQERYEEILRHSIEGKILTVLRRGK